MERMILRLEDERDFRRIPRLRKTQDSDGTAIAYSNRKALARDHLYFHGAGTLGIYYERETKQAARSARAWYKARCGEVVEELPGDFDGLILFRVESTDDIPEVFFRCDPRGIAITPTLQAVGPPPKPGDVGPDGDLYRGDSPEAFLAGIERPQGHGVELVDEKGQPIAQ